MCAVDREPGLVRKLELPDRLLFAVVAVAVAST